MKYVNTDPATCKHTYGVTNTGTKHRHCHCNTDLSWCQHQTAASMCSVWWRQAGISWLHWVLELGSCQALMSLCWVGSTSGLWDGSTESSDDDKRSSEASGPVAHFQLYMDQSSPLCTDLLRCNNRPQIMPPCATSRSFSYRISQYNITL